MPSDLMMELGEQVLKAKQDGTLTQKKAAELCRQWLMLQQEEGERARFMKEADRVVSKVPLYMALPGSTPEKMCNWMLAELHRIRIQPTFTDGDGV